MVFEPWIATLREESRPVTPKGGDWSNESNGTERYR
jgi:hypothetical protein